MSNIVSDLVKQICTEQLRPFVESYCWIQNKFDAEQEGFLLHAYQSKIVEIEEWCEANKVPCRIVGCKPRRGGSSTISVASLYHRLKKKIRRACILGGSDYQGSMMFKMLALMSRKDRLVKTRVNVLDKEARFPNGSYCIRVNASGTDAAVSGGFTFLHVTELAKWAKDGVAAAAPVLSAALKCVPFLPDTTIIIESTAEGIGDEFARIYSTGITFDELKAGKVGYVKVFAPWFEFADAVLDPASMGITSVSDLTPQEIELQVKHSLSLANIAWMRYTIHDQCHDSFEEFKRDYPFDDVSCFLLSGNKVFNSESIRKMREDSARFPLAYGTIDFVNGSKESAVIWRPCGPEECRVIRLEQPQDGLRYLLSVDNMTGASQAMGLDPDNHAVLVWRAGFEQGGKFHPPRVVAMLVADWQLWMNKRRYELKWDIDVLEAMIWKLSCYFGKCKIVPEMNKESGLVELLKLRDGVDLYIRQAWNQREQKESNVYGFLTTDKTRNQILSELIRGVREYSNFDPLKGWNDERCEIYLPPILDELDTFIEKSNGRKEAMQGQHDDLCMSAAIGLYTINSATTYVRPTSHRQMPWETEETRQQTGGTYS